MQGLLLGLACEAKKVLAMLVGQLFALYTEGRRNLGRHIDFRALSSSSVLGFRLAPIVESTCARSSPSMANLSKVDVDRVQSGMPEGEMPVGLHSIVLCVGCGFNVSRGVVSRAPSGASEASVI